MKTEPAEMNNLQNFYSPSPNRLYWNEDNIVCKCEQKLPGEMDFLALYRVDEITFEDKSPRKEALENVISSMNIPGVNFVYIIMGDSTGVRFYYGAARDFMYTGECSVISEIGEKILRPSLQGNFRGSVITEIGADDRKELLSNIDKFEESSVLEGVPGINKDDEKFQSVDRVIDVMLGDRFALMLVAKPIDRGDINAMQGHIENLYNIVASASKATWQETKGENKGTSRSETTGISDTKGDNNSVSKQHSEAKNTSHTESKNRKGQSSDSGTNDSTGSTESASKTTTKGNSSSHTDNKSETTTEQNSENTGSSASLEVVNKKYQNWMKYMDEVLMPRLDYGMGKGLFVTSILLLGDNPNSLLKLENTLKSVYGGETGNRMPLQACKVQNEAAEWLKRMQMPKISFKPAANNEKIVRYAHSQFCVDNTTALLGNWMSSQEISLLAGVPQKEVVGLTLREEVDFGLNLGNKKDDAVLLGHLVQSGVVLDGKNDVPNIPVYFDKKNFDRHIFVTGVTGGGKTTTCQKLLLEKGENFLVIEPAKTEYRILAEKYKDMLVFTLGRENAAPFRLNPFEFFEGENITSRVDMIMASMTAAFDMEAAIPQLFEAAIYECYKDKGWDITNNANTMYDNPYAAGVDSFPMLGDLEKKIDGVVAQQGFDDRLKNDYIGSMKARLKGLMVGAKGLMLNTPRSVDFVDLLDRKVVLELEHIKGASEKALIMGFILSNLSEAIKAKYDKVKGDINHITLIEEAHRLLSKYMPGDSLNKKQGVEMFADMLAEVRKYGESLIIVDQIPNKLTPEVLKNTNTKIVHKIFAQDDKEAIGNTMALKDEQKEYLSYLPSGRAVMMMPEIPKAIQVQIQRTEDNDTERMPLDDNSLRERILGYYIEGYISGSLKIPGFEDDIPDAEFAKFYWQNLQKQSLLIKEYEKCIFWGRDGRKVSQILVEELRRLTQQCDLDKIAHVVFAQCHRKDVVDKNPGFYDYIFEILEKIVKEGDAYSIKTYSHRSKLSDTLISKEGF